MERSACTSFFDLSLIEQPALVDFDPDRLIGFVVRVQPAYQFPKVLAGMKQIDDFDRSGEVGLRKIPDPFSSIADDDLLGSATPTAFPRFQIDPLAELFGGLDGASVGGGIRVADRVAFFVPSGLRDTSLVGRAPVRAVGRYWGALW
jgi:hypothetical protein